VDKQEVRIKVQFMEKEKHDAHMYPPGTNYLKPLLEILLFLFLASIYEYKAIYSRYSKKI
jgi:hypothetical protein